MDSVEQALGSDLGFLSPGQAPWSVVFLSLPENKHWPGTIRFLPARAQGERGTRAVCGEVTRLCAVQPKSFSLLQLMTQYNP